MYHTERWWMGLVVMMGLLGWLSPGWAAEPADKSKAPNPEPPGSVASANAPIPSAQTVAELRAKIHTALSALWQEQAKAQPDQDKIRQLQKQLVELRLQLQTALRQTNVQHAGQNPPPAGAGLGPARTAPAWAGPGARGVGPVGPGAGAGLGPRAGFGPGQAAGSGPQAGIGPGPQAGVGPGPQAGFGPGPQAGFGPGFGPGPGRGLGRGAGIGYGPGMGYGKGPGPSRGWGVAPGAGQGGPAGPGGGQGRGLGPGMGAGRGGPWFIDQNQNGICDRWEAVRGNR